MRLYRLLIPAALAACEPIAVDLRTIDKPAGDPLCVVAGFGCASLADLEQRYGVRGCPDPLVAYGLPCDVEPDPASDLICCGPPTLSFCEEVGGRCISVLEQPTCPGGLIATRDLSCETESGPRPDLFCCIPEPPPDECTLNGFACIALSGDPRMCPPPSLVQPFNCTTEPGSGAPRTCCG